METSLDCLPCMMRQAIDGARRVSDDSEFVENAAREMAGWLKTADYSQSPPVMAQRLHRWLYKLTNVADPYVYDKVENNRLALEMMPELRKKIADSDDPLRLAVQYAIAGNLIDLGVCSELAEDVIRNTVINADKEPFSGDMQFFKRRLDRAESILYLADNAGEIVLDRLLVELLDPARVTVVVRGAPILNDATLEDARVAGLCDMVKVIPNGSDVPGTLLEECSEELRELYWSSDVVISKGQGNFETLSETTRDICFLLKVKCAVIAERLTLPRGTSAMVWLQAGNS